MIVHNNREEEVEMPKIRAQETPRVRLCYAQPRRVENIHQKLTILGGTICARRFAWLCWSANSLSLRRPLRFTYKASVPDIYFCAIFRDSFGRSPTQGFDANTSTAAIDLLPKNASYGSPSAESALLLIQVKTYIARRVQCDGGEIYLQISGGSSAQVPIRAC